MGYAVERLLKAHVLSAALFVAMTTGGALVMAQIGYADELQPQDSAVLGGRKSVKVALRVQPGFEARPAASLFAKGVDRRLHHLTAARPAHKSLKVARSIQASPPKIEARRSIQAIDLDRARVFTSQTQTSARLADLEGTLAAMDAGSDTATLTSEIASERIRLAAFKSELLELQIERDLVAAVPNAIGEIGDLKIQGAAQNKTHPPSLKSKGGAKVINMIEQHSVN
ncbi:hypothetical protein [Litoreibacter roseus]|uniref:Uncharacterized protein n=1 Tax=Litoreibacter roseus TaxID=2601869 RepID=A0A6N6JCX9_9RHOB|nr:hypothetical protein [Litoreibacter roseus]GFE64193.1 hypothetical protein KIN_12670 [Litoreibacter roseus]